MIIVFANPLTSQSMRAKKRDLMRIKAGILRRDEDIVQTAPQRHERKSIFIVLH